MDIHVTIFRVEVLEAHNVHADMGSQVWQTGQNLKREKNDWLVLLVV